LQWVADAVGGRVAAGDPEQAIGTVTTDSRTLRPGDFFVALRGPKFDAHDFVEEAYRRGATGAMLERGHRAGRVDPPGIVEVGDTTKGLQDLAHAVRRAAGTRVIAITGSAGKTTTKDTIAEFLSTRLRVVKNRGNLNNHIGLPLSLMQLRERPDVAVMELGMNHAGEISTLVAIAEPEVRVWTNVGDAHIGFFASPDAIADAKAEILERAESGHLLVCDADDPRVMTRARRFAGRVVTFGVSEDATVRARQVEDLGIHGMRATVTTPVGERQITTPLLGRGNLANVLAATAVAIDFGVSLDAVATSASRLQAADRRGAVRALGGNVTLIDDSYNSSPAALARALDVLAKDTQGVRRVAVLGEMLELGDHATRLHRESGRTAAQSGIDVLFVIGAAPARAMVDGAIDAGMPAGAVRYFEDSEAAASVIANEIRDGDVVLVKGSRGTRTDVVADSIAAGRT
jgi:UDP-N-acetylmuramoyl-tripeptide--D-alanyl-D-alanine ligase